MLWVGDGIVFCTKIYTNLVQWVGDGAEGVSLACETLLSAKALKTLDLWIQISKVSTCTI